MSYVQNPLSFKDDLDNPLTYGRVFLYFANTFIEAPVYRFDSTTSTYVEIEQPIILDALGTNTDVYLNSDISGPFDTLVQDHNGVTQLWSPAIYSYAFVPIVSKVPTPVDVAPTITMVYPSYNPTPNPTLEVGDVYSMIVETTGDMLSLQWYKNGDPIPFATNPLYRIDGATYEDIGVYSCIATNSAGTQVEVSNTVNVI